MGEAIWTAKENVLIRAGACAVTVRPDLGGKIASILIGDRELLQPPLRAYGTRTKNMSFDSADASGWDECLPSVAACRVATGEGEVNVPDHGDLWRVEWEPADAASFRKQDAEQSEVTLRGRCFSLPLTLERSLRLAETSWGWELNLNYTVKNESDSPVPWSWSAHPLFVVEAGDRIVLPATIKSLRVEGSRANRVGVHGEEVEWPIAALNKGGSSDLSVVLGRKAESATSFLPGRSRLRKAGASWSAQGNASGFGFGLSLRRRPISGSGSALADGRRGLARSRCVWRSNRLRLRWIRWRNWGHGRVRLSRENPTPGRCGLRLNRARYEQGVS